MNPNTPATKIERNSPSLVQIWCSQGLRVIACSDLDLLTPTSSQHIYEPKYNCNQNWVKFPSLLF